MIHNVGTEFFPVDESSNHCSGMVDRRAIEPLPMFALALPRRFSTRLFGMTLILASTSPIRRQMLAAAGVTFETAKPQVDEDEVKSRLSDSSEIALALAQAKALDISAASPDDWVIGSDSVVSVDGRLFDKPRDRSEAEDHLRFFSGKTMVLTSGVALGHGRVIDWSHVGSAKLIVRALSDAFIDTYLDSEWPEVGYCVGVFRMEGRGVQLFEEIEGNHFTILGMPLLPLLGALREREILPV
jgi:septum formation protein